MVSSRKKGKIHSFFCFEIQVFASRFLSGLLSCRRSVVVLKENVGGRRHFEPIFNSMLTHSKPVSFGLRPAISTPADAGSDPLLQTLLESAPYSKLTLFLRSNARSRLNQGLLLQPIDGAGNYLQGPIDF